MKTFNHSKPVENVKIICLNSSAEKVFFLMDLLFLKIKKKKVKRCVYTTYDIKFKIYIYIKKKKKKKNDDEEKLFFTSE
jgi:hypothetical protein